MFELISLLTKEEFTLQTLPQVKEAIKRDFEKARKGILKLVEA